MVFNIAESGNHFTCIADSGSLYHITPHSCPGCKRVIYLCTCAAFKFKIVQDGDDPFHLPCDHIVELVLKVGADKLHQVTKV